MLCHNIVLYPSQLTLFSSLVERKGNDSAITKVAKKKAKIDSSRNQDAENEQMSCIKYDGVYHNSARSRLYPHHNPKITETIMEAFPDG
jgi:hypothetical protein